jgi:hypothetical protein
MVVMRRFFIVFISMVVVEEALLIGRSPASDTGDARRGMQKQADIAGCLHALGRY